MTTKLNMAGMELLDVGILRKMVSLEIVSLSVNKLQDLSALKNCPNIRELYLRRNCISDFKQLQPLVGLKKLSVLSLNGNPIETEHTQKSYRATVIKMLPQLHKLDEIDVCEQDLAGSKKPIKK